MYYSKLNSNEEQNNKPVDLFADNEPKEERDEQVSPYWIDHPEMKKRAVDFLPTNEVQFWKDLIEKYLFVLIKDKEVCVITSAVHSATLNMPIF
jgi:recombinational DNA repair protein RecT